MAVSPRVLLRDTDSSTSLLLKLGVKDELSFVELFHPGPTVTGGVLNATELGDVALVTVRLDVAPAR